MKIVVLFIISFLLFACKKPADRNCVKFHGKDSQNEIFLGEFHKVFLGSHIKYVLVPDVENKMIVSGSKNTINLITSGIEGGLLTIENKNKCNFLRSYKRKITVELHFKDINNILYEGTEELTTVGTITTPDLFVLIRDGAGPMNLNLNTDVLNFKISNGWGNYVLNGNVKYANFDIKSNGFGDASGLNIQDSIHIVSNSSEQNYFNADQASLKAQTFTFGNIYYKGTPSDIEFNQYGSGQLIHY